MTKGTVTLKECEDYNRNTVVIDEIIDKFKYPAERYRYNRKHLNFPFIHTYFPDFKERDRIRFSSKMGGNA